MKICKHCKMEIDDKAKVCPHCRKKQDGGCLTTIIGFVCLLFGLIILSGACSGGEDDGTGHEKTNSIETSSDTKVEDVVENPNENSNDGMDVDEILKAAGVKYLTDCKIQNEDNGDMKLLFALRNYAMQETSVPAVVEIRMVNNNNETVYESTKNIEVKDFGYWSNIFGDQTLLASITIKKDDIKNGTIGSGTAIFRVYNDVYFEFEDYEITILEGLPIIPIKMKLPSVPVSVSDIGWDGNKDSTCKISSVEYTESFQYSNSITFYFSGEKTYDAKGNGNNSYCIFNYKLTDGDGFVIDSGNVFTSEITVGEKFKEKVTCYSEDIKPGGSYTLTIFDYQ